MKLTTGEIKILIKNCLSEVSYSSVPEIKQYIAQNTIKEFTNGQIIGAIGQLVKRGDIENVERGVYKKNNNEKLFLNGKDFNDQIKLCLNNTMNELSSIIKRTDIIALDEKDYKKINRIKELKEYIDLTIEELK